jgi:pimeloyl-ACP methyl ester carboxylesterase
MALKAVCFSHGQESDPWGTKIRAMADAARDEGWVADSLDYRGIDDARVRADKLVEYCRAQDGPIVLVGSSMGGYVATAAASRSGARGLFLLAPALFMPGYGEYMPEPLPDVPTMIVHGWHDDVVPHEGSIRYGRETGASVVLLDGDHRLTANIKMITFLLRKFLANLDDGADQ